MNEYIEKEPLLKIAKELQKTAFGSPLIVRAIENAPVADVVEVVRCEECKHCESCYPKKEKGKEAEIVYYCTSLDCIVNPDDFCSYGERRE